MFDDAPPLTDAQVAARLYRCVVDCWPCPVCNAGGVQPYGGWIEDEFNGCGTCAAM